MSSNLLAQFSFPFILDKLSATSLETKIECLTLIQKMVEQYEPYQIIEKHLPIAIHQILNEYFSYFVDKLQIVAAETIAKVVKKIY